MPAGIECALALGLDIAVADLVLLDLVHRFLDLRTGPDDADQIIHGLLQLGVQGVGILRFGRPLRPLEGLQSELGRSLDRVLGHGRPIRQRTYVIRRTQSGPATKHQQIGQ